MPLDAMCQKMRRLGYNKNTGILCSSDCRQKAILPPKGENSSFYELKEYERPEKISR